MASVILTDRDIAQYENPPKFLTDNDIDKLSLESPSKTSILTDRDIDQLSKPNGPAASISQFKFMDVPGVSLLKKAFSPETMKRGFDVSGAGDIPAIIQDISSIPSRLAGFKTIPWQSKLATEAIPQVLEKATTPVPIPSFSMQNIKSLLKGKGLTDIGRDLSPVDLAFIGLGVKGSFSNAMNLARWNAYLNKGIQTEKIRGVVLNNIEPLEKALKLGGVNLPVDLSVADKASVILSQAEKSPKLGSVIAGLENGSIKPLAPGVRVDITSKAKVAPTAKAPVAEPPIVSSVPAVATPTSTLATPPVAPVVPPISAVQPPIAPKITPQAPTPQPDIITKAEQAPVIKPIEPKVNVPDIQPTVKEKLNALGFDQSWDFLLSPENEQEIIQKGLQPQQISITSEGKIAIISKQQLKPETVKQVSKEDILRQIKTLQKQFNQALDKEDLTRASELRQQIKQTQEVIKMKFPAKRQPKTLIGYVISQGGLDPQKLAKDYNVKLDFQETGLLSILRRGGRTLDDFYDELVGQNLIPPAPENVNPMDWVKQQITESKGKYLESTKAFEKQLEKEYNDFVESEKVGGVTDEDVRAEQEAITQDIEKEITAKQDEAVIGEANWRLEFYDEFAKRIDTVTTPEELKDILSELTEEASPVNKDAINELTDKVDERYFEITKIPTETIPGVGEQLLIKGTKQRAMPSTPLAPKKPQEEIKLTGLKYGLSPEKQKEMFKPGGVAFAMPEGGLEEWVKRTQEQNIQLKPLEMPELVKLAQELMGKYPIVKKLVTNLGLFKFGKGIALDVKIFKNPQIAGIVLAHEIGHLIDWLPDYTIARGNILGRIATLRRYLKSTLAEKPGMEGTVLTPKDRERLRRVAELELKAELKLGEREIIEEIFKEVPIYEQTKLTPDEVLSIWREQGTTARITNPQLYDFIARLSSAQKKSIIQQALKGVIDERLLQLQGGKKIGIKIIKEQVTRRIIPEEVTPQAIRKRFKQLLKEEIIKRKLFSLEVIKEELKKVTQWWNPFDDTVKGWYVNYRYGADELYAEAISVLLNKPEKLEEIAPQFYKAFWNYIDRKPEVKKALLELQDFLNMGEGEKLRVRQEDVYSMFKKGEELFYDKRKEYELREKSLWFKLKAELIDKNIGVLDKLKLTEKQGKIINPEDNPKYYLEEYNYIGGKLKNDLDGIQKGVRDNLEKSGLDDEQFGSYLFFRRVVTERSDIANPLGHNRDTAQRQLEYLHSILGDEKFGILESSSVALRNKMEALLLESEKIGFYKPETIKELITNKEYASFQVLDYLDDYVSPSVIQQIGTLKPIANPFTSTILKMLSLRRAIERVKTNNSVINFMISAFPKEIERAKTRHISKYKSEIPEKEGFAIIKTRESGKLVGYYVDPYIAQSVNATPRNINNAVISVLRFLNSGYFRPVYVNLNLGFQTFNFLRDFVRAWKLNPGTSFPAMLGYYWKALPIAKQRIWGNFSPPVIAEMQQNGMLSFTYNNIMRGIEKDDETQIEFLLRQYDILKKNPNNPVKEVFNFIEELGDFVETIPKVAGYLSRIKDPNKRNIKEIAHEVRIFSGSPDFLRKNAGYDWSNNTFLFSNAIKEGIRADIEGALKNPRTRSGYWWRTAKITFLPKILAFLATLGFFGQKIKENFDKQTEYDKTNYTTIPLGMTEAGKAIYMRLPQDEMGRLLGGIFWKSLSLAKEQNIKSTQDILSLMGGQVPSASPVIELTSSWAQYLTGKNPYDWFRGREILTDDERMAGGWYSLKPMTAWTAGKLGIYGATIKAQNDETTIEKTVKWTPILQRFIRITDYGETEAERKDRQERTREKAIRSIQKKELK